MSEVMKQVAEDLDPVKYFESRRRQEEGQPRFLEVLIERVELKIQGVEFHNDNYSQHTGPTQHAVFHIAQQKLPIRKLVYKGGWPHIKRGDQVTAFIFKADKYNPSTISDDRLEVYNPRNFREQETAIRIETSDGTIYNSVGDFEKFKKQIVNIRSAS